MFFVVFLFSAQWAAAEGVVVELTIGQFTPEDVPPPLVEFVGVDFDEVGLSACLYRQDGETQPLLGVEKSRFIGDSWIRCLDGDDGPILEVEYLRDVTVTPEGRGDGGKKNNHPVQLPRNDGLWMLK